MQPILLTDKSRLQEIYDLRVLAHENSHNKDLINRKLFPNGWFDNLEVSGVHWIVTNEKDEIIASARLNILQAIEDIEYHQVFTKYPLPPNRPFGFLSRLVIHPNHRTKGYARMLDEVRIGYLQQENIFFALNTAQEIRAKSLLKNGFELLGIEDVQFQKTMVPDKESILIVYPYKIVLPLERQAICEAAI